MRGGEPAPARIGRRPLEACRFPFLLPALLAAGLAAAGSSWASGPPPGETMTCRDIDAVLRAHDDELLAVPGVVGVYVGLLDDGRTPCLRVMVEERTPALERRIPGAIEGCPVVLEETGAVRPL